MSRSFIMEDKKQQGFSRRAVFLEAFHYSFPVLLGYLTLGTAFGFMLSTAGYPVGLALVMSVWMYAGAGQFIALGFFAAGTPLWQACIIQLVVNIRHSAYGLSMINRFRGAGVYKPYLIFSLTDETFALLSSLPVPDPARERSGALAGAPSPAGKNTRLLMIYIAVLDHSYWIAGSLIGAAAGKFIPFDMEGLGFTLTALFVVLMVEQIAKIKKPGVFIISSLAALLGVFLFPGSVSLLAALALALFLAAFSERLKPRGGTHAQPQ